MVDFITFVVSNGSLSFFIIGLLVSGMPGVNGLTPGLVVGLDDGGLAWVVDLAAGGGGR